MSKYQDIIEAKGLLDLPERASMEEIKSKYRQSIKQWHPDKFNANEEQCDEMTKKLNAAYKTIMAYCEEYKYSFAEEEVKRYLSIEEWWSSKFGDDPLWGNPDKP